MSGMFLTVRPETAQDHIFIKKVLDEAFQTDQESRLVEALRREKEFISELSLVAECGGQVIGYLLFYPVSVNAGGSKRPILSLAPMAVSPDFQRKGFGKELLDKGLRLAKNKGYGAVVVLGHPEYYGKFGFVKAGFFDVRSPWDGPEETYMVLALRPGALDQLRGVVEYPRVFFDLGSEEKAGE